MLPGLKQTGGYQGTNRKKIMMDDTDIDGDGADDQSESQENEFPIPASLLGPEAKVGAAIEIKVGGKISRMDGDNAVLAVETVNGQPLPEDEPADQEETSDDEDDAPAPKSSADFRKAFRSSESSDY